MNSLICFILGMIFIIFVLPVIESAASAIQVYFEAVKSSMGVEIATNNKHVNDLCVDAELSSVNVIGFQADDAERYCCDETDDECDFRKTNNNIFSHRNLIGFHAER